MGLLQNFMIACYMLASWYLYSIPGFKDYGANNLTAASRDYPRGTILEVCRADIPEKCVEVRVNDYVENPKVSVDLSQYAFSKLAPFSRGIIPITIKEQKVELK